MSEKIHAWGIESKNNERTHNKKLTISMLKTFESNLALIFNPL